LSHLEELREYYYEWWENPKDIRSEVLWRLNEHVRERIPPGKVKRALDIGSGRGTIVSYLVEKGHDVTAVDISEKFASELKRKFPDVEAVCGDARNINFSRRLHITTCIEVAQNLNEKDLRGMSDGLAGVTDMLFISMSKKNSLHSHWVNLRGFKKSFVFNYSPSEFEKLLTEASFQVIYRRGIGLVTPISLFPNFKIPLITSPLASLINRVDKYATKICHLY